MGFPRFDKFVQVNPILGLALALGLALGLELGVGLEKQWSLGPNIKKYRVRTKYSKISA